ncbi:MAG: 3'(2'),5'-bisphosphate nucleotidase CysQ [Rhizobiaceae bacterium]|nr:3'(2'),5'-bisphosphate nucleotidase CysQ [Rhizobiaceae bacterium]
MEENNAGDLALLEEIMEGAGKIAMKYFKAENEVWMKPGDSPVSRADMEVNSFLQLQLLAARPDYGWLSEENEDSARRLDCKRIFVVDPIDGTRGFINGRDQWCISVAVVEDERPVAAVLECPALNERYSTMKGSPSLLNGSPITARHSTNIAKATGSLKINEIISASLAGRVEVTKFVPSLAYRIAMVATGDIDVAFARPGSHDWDLAAADLILANADGNLVDGDCQLLRYNQPQIKRKGLIACQRDICDDALELAKSVGILH